MSDALRDTPRGERRTDTDLVKHVRTLRIGHGANCSSIGSVIDTLFIGTLLGGAIFAAIAAALATEPVRVTGPDPDERREKAPGGDDRGAP